MTDWTKPPTGQDPSLAISSETLEHARESLRQRGLENVAKQIRDHYSPRQYQPDTFVAYQGDNPIHLALELLATIASEDLTLRYPDRSPADHDDSFLGHLDLLRAFVPALGELQCDHLLNDKVWFWTNVVCEQEPDREQLVQDIQQQMEAEFERRAEQWIRRGYQMRVAEEKRENGDV